MDEGFCLICAESYELPTVSAVGVCGRCQLDDCDCGDICSSCADDLQALEGN
jgi:hypothetical protein